MEVAPGVSRLELSVEGAAEGIFLWRRPYLDTGPRGWSPERPPLVLVTLDTTRRDVLGAYGSDAGATPARIRRWR